jgi:hypothetical protein
MQGIESSSNEFKRMRKINLAGGGMKMPKSARRRCGNFELDRNFYKSIMAMSRHLPSRWEGSNRMANMATFLTHDT